MDKLRNTPTLARQVTSEFISLLRSRPDLILRYVAEELFPTNIVDIVSSTAFLSIFARRWFLANGTIAYRDVFRNLESISVGDSVLVLADLLSKVVSACLGIAFVTGLVLAVRTRSRGTTFAALLHLLVVSGLYFGHAIIHLEPRYILAAHFLLLMDTTVVFTYYWHRRKLQRLRLAGGSRQ